jgi:predicted AAA+ superfamily ATPase
MLLQNCSMWIERKISTVLHDFTAQFPVVALAGARQTGKTSLLKHLFPKAEYVTFDDPLRASDAESRPEEFLSKLGSPAIIDEVQYVPKLFRFIKLVVDRKKGGCRFLLTGSQQFFLMQKLSESLAGRCGVLELSTLSASECAESKTRFRLEEYIIRGGYPALHAQSMDFTHWFPSYISTYLERDVRNMLNVASLRDFNRFLRALAARSACTLSFSEIARDVGVAPNTIRSWVSILEASGIIRLLEPYYRNIGKRLVKSPKVYFLDTGLLAHLLGFSGWAEIERSPYLGYIWETYVFTQVFKQAINSGIVKPNLWFWRTSSGEEVDFLVEKGGQFIVVECKYTGNPNEDDLRGFAGLKKYYGPNCIIKAFLACKVKARGALTRDVTVSNFIDEPLV